MDPRLQPVFIERRGVKNPGAPVRGRARLQTGFALLLANREKFQAMIKKSKVDNENFLTRTRPSALRKQRTAANNWFLLLQGLEPHLDEERFWDIDIIERHGMHMVPVLVRISAALAAIRKRNSKLGQSLSTRAFSKNSWIKFIPVRLFYYLCAYIDTLISRHRQQTPTPF